MSSITISALRDKTLMFFSYSIGALSRTNTTPSNIQADHILADDMIMYTQHMRALFDLAANHPDEFHKLVDRYPSPSKTP